LHDPATSVKSDNWRLESETPPLANFVDNLESTQHAKKSLPPQQLPTRRRTNTGAKAPPITKREGNQLKKNVKNRRTKKKKKKKQKVETKEKKIKKIKA